jgi:hypothetical protein
MEDKWEESNPCVLWSAVSSVLIAFEFSKNIIVHLFKPRILIGAFPIQTLAMKIELEFQSLTLISKSSLDV